MIYTIYLNASNELIAYFDGDVDSAKHDAISGLSRHVVFLEDFDGEFEQEGGAPVVIPAAEVVRAESQVAVIIEAENTDILSGLNTTANSDFTIYQDSEIEIKWDASANEPLYRKQTWGWNGIYSMVSKQGTRSPKASTGYASSANNQWLRYTFGSKKTNNITLPSGANGEFLLHRYFDRDQAPEYHLTMGRNGNTIHWELIIKRVNLID